MNTVKNHITPLEDIFISKLIEKLNSVEGVTALILYGSRASGFSDEDSDLDIAVITDRSLSHERLNIIRDKILEDMDVLGELRVGISCFAQKEIKHLPIGNEIEAGGILLWKRPEIDQTPRKTCSDSNKAGLDNKS